MTTKDLLEIILFVITGGSALATGGFTFATLRAENRIDTKVEDFRDEIENFRKEFQDKIDISREFERKAKQNINNSLVEIGLNKAAIRDIKTVLRMYRAEALPEENKPERTDFT
ncbi:hypothetical protein QUA70_12320 [Microcoleus sp. LAD1_D5]|uniref:hypothetical protein n=1 Tax=unclassified Microcoleus TaxID=2642155 RepID=UPI002FD0B6AA